jgi:hypothetical protein
MRIILLGVLAGALAGLAPNALGELYRWRDPQSGSIKYSTYPPPWYGDQAREAQSPKVEVLTGEREAAAAKSAPVDAMAEKVAEVIQFMEKRREQLRTRMTVARASAGFNLSDPAFQADLQAYRAVSRELDKFDSKGAVTRRAADATVFEDLGVESRATPGAQTVPSAPGEPPRRGAGQPPPVDRPDRAR